MSLPRSVLRIIALSCTLAATAAWAQDQPAAPADAQPVEPIIEQPVAQPDAQPDAQPGAGQAQQLEATVTAVDGKLAQVRSGPDQQWQDAQVGMKLTAGAEFRTGPRARIQFTLPPDQTVTIDRLTVVTLLEAAQQGQTVKTDLGMLRGRTVYDVQDPAVVHEASIKSPSATNAVRGTQSLGLSENSLYGAQAFAINNKTTFTNESGQNVPIGGAGQTANINGDEGSVGEHNFLLNILDPSTPGARQENEMLLVGRFAGLGGLDAGRLTGAFRQGQTARQVSSDFGSSFFFRLFVVLTWNTSADLDLFVRDSDGFVISTFSGVDPNAVSSAPNGGTAGPDVPSGPGGEIVYYTKQQIPTGNLEAGAYYNHGPETSFLIHVFKDGQLVDSPLSGTVGPDNPTQTGNFNISDGGGGIGQQQDGRSATNNRARRHRK